VRDKFLNGAGIRAVPPAGHPTNLSEMELTAFFELRVGHPVQQLSKMPTALTVWIARALILTLR